MVHLDLATHVLKTYEILFPCEIYITATLVALLEPLPVSPEGLDCLSA